MRNQSKKQNKKNQSFTILYLFFPPYLLCEIRGEWQLLRHNNESTGWEKRDWVAGAVRTAIRNKLPSKSCGKEGNKINIWGVRTE